MMCFPSGRDIFVLSLCPPHTCKFVKKTGTFSKLRAFYFFYPHMISTHWAAQQVPRRQTENFFLIWGCQVIVEKSLP